MMVNSSAFCRSTAVERSIAEKKRALAKSPSTPPSDAPMASSISSSGWSGSGLPSAKNAVTRAAPSVAIVQSMATDAGSSGETASSSGRRSVVVPKPAASPKNALMPLRMR